MKGLNSGDDDQLKSAMHKADEFIKSQKVKGSDKDEEKDLPRTTTGQNYSFGSSNDDDDDCNSNNSSSKNNKNESDDAHKNST